MRSDELSGIGQLQHYDARLPLLTLARMRAALALVFRSDDVALLTNELPAILSSDVLRRVVRQAVNRYSLLRVRSRFQKHVEPDRTPLGAATGLPTHSALALALHIGAAVGCEQLGDAFDRSPADIGALLDQGRRAVDPTMPLGCRARVGLVGRYRDRHMEAGERIELLTHLRSCERCQCVVERAKTIDEELETAASVLAERLGADAPARMLIVRRAARTGGFLLAGGRHRRSDPALSVDSLAVEYLMDSSITMVNGVVGFLVVIVDYVVPDKDHPR